MVNFITTYTVARIAIKAIWANKMRSALTSLGIIIGVGAVIAMTAIGAGASKDISDRVAKMGSNTINLQAGAASGGGFSFSSQAKYLTTDDVAAIKREIRTIDEVYATITQSKNVTSANTGTMARVMGTTNEIFNVQPWYIAEGRKFTEAEINGAATVCILGSETSKELFADMNPVEQPIRLDGQMYKVVGLMKEVGEGSWGFDPDNGIIVPLSTMQTKLGAAANRPKYVQTITIKAKSYDLISDTEDEVKKLMRQRHKLLPRQEDDFYIRNLAQMLNTMKGMATTMSLLLGAIASISLLVGGIGIMNIMLVSVTERTREIGIRMAIGASLWDIRLQFLMEAMILSILGGIIGITLGLSIAFGLEHFANMVIEITLSSVLLSFFVSAAIGISFGFYPAYKASKLNPIDALRYE
ncbi:ABC-type efflux carrier [Elusimicrobium minutum Pei191]|uniref:ABC-type efflux carrier n=1 Tax=Elusimicrobium minutum (strain Pei191) TaxID=445932 RepID=B2KDY4_ELUMP|nr:ABC transporter permease [Elusimicrobium minutum]ACC98730.1 ABC-type efflux carrier [Elusimicrobium minutum Pei191]